mgnify:CR=1 FL=1
MAGVTDIPFRKMVRKWAKDCLVFTEMINSVSFVQAKKVEFIAQTCEDDFPIVYQFSGHDPYYLTKAGQRAQEIGASAVDINMGCPTQKIVKKGEGSSLLKDINKTRQIFEDMVKNIDIPITVKIRAGWDEHSIIAKEYAMLAEECGLAAIAIHGRTRCQFYQGEANWDFIKDAQEAVSIPVIGSGDLWTPYDAKRMIDYTGCAGLWVARGCLGNPWVVAQMDSYIREGKIEPEFSDAERIGFMLEHLALMVEYTGERCAIPASRKHIAWCIKDLPGCEEIRIKVNKLVTYSEVADVLKNYQEFLFSREDEKN